MTKWEYLFDYKECLEQDDDCRCELDGLNKLGKDGWELFHIDSTFDSKNPQYLFKRPLKEEINIEE